MNELKVGVDHENKEHRDITHGSKVVAQKIAIAHIKEDPQYYSHLKVMEEAVEKKKSIKEALQRTK